MADLKPSPNESSPSEWKSPRTYLALGIPALCIAWIFTLSLMLFLHPGADDKTNNFKKDILNVLLPLAGTWIGTILAFYFSRDNFVAANKSVRDLAQTVSTVATSAATGVEKILAKDRMIPFQKIDAIEDVPEPDLIKALQNLQAGDRLPIFNHQTQAIRYVLHRSVIDKYRIKAGNPTVLPLSVILKDQEVSGYAQAIGVCPETATMGDVKDTMYRIPGCQDVFITKTGLKTEPVLGWVTNVILQESLKA